jgi:predicted metallopeptidase
MEWNAANDVKKQLREIIKTLDLKHVIPSRIFCFRTNGSKSRAYARIWSFPKIFQISLNIEPAYVIEVLSKYYDKLDLESQKRVLIHELLHIPKNFSGALLSHRGRNRHLQKEANKLYEEYVKKVRQK